MRNVFISFHFSEDFNSPDRILSNQIEGLLRSHSLTATTGAALGGGELTREIQNLIDKSDALIALLSRRDKKENGEWGSHPWVQDEYAYAKNNGIRAIAIVEAGVTPQGMNQANEYVSYNPDDPLAAFLKLSSILGIWRADAGRQVKLLVQPTEVALNYGTDAEWRYRFNEHGQYSIWHESSLSREPGGCFLYLSNVSDDALIQVEARSRSGSVESICSPQWVVVNFEEN